MKQPIAIQKLHEKQLPVTKIEWELGEVSSITVDYGEDSAPRYVTYTDEHGGKYDFPITVNGEPCITIDEGSLK